MKQNVVIGILGTQLDRGGQAKRWKRWRPTIAICQQPDLPVHRLELLHPATQRSLAEQVREDIAIVSPQTKVFLRPIDFKDPWDFEEVFGRLHDFARAYEFHTDENDYLINITTGSHVQQICLFLLTETRHLPGRLLQGSPAKRDADYSPGTYRVIDLDLSRYDKLATRFADERREGSDFLKSGIATRNTAFNQLIEQLERVAIASTAPILLAGPTGAGKTQLARRIYELKRRREQISGSFVEINCATLRGDQAMSTLFGHIKGAFTGASMSRKGLLKNADKGLLFLDEIGELGLDEQAMLLRAVEERRFLPVGSDCEVESNFQLIAGTNRNLPRLVQAGAFREDLFARINLWTFQLPGLASRPEDIEPNLDFELDQISSSRGRKVSMTREARGRLLRFATSPSAEWTGNFRDLGAAVTRMATFASGGRIGTEEVESEILRLQAHWQASGTASPPTDNLLSSVLSREQIESIDRFDQAQLVMVIETCRRCSSLSEAGRALFNVSRLSRTSTNDADRLRKYLARFDLSWTSVQHSPDESVAL
ncbi:MAG: RNA repair transcriptional activator RtcR [Planctomycetaceae bacterium]|nr:RNA repair transcriptional activator RtcR [Planctomycetaceae bacterium]